MRISVKTARATGDVGSRAPRYHRSWLPPGVDERLEYTCRSSLAGTGLRSDRPVSFFQFLIFLLDRPALMRQVDERLQRRGDRQIDQVYFVRGVAPRSRSANTHTSGASRR